MWRWQQKPSSLKRLVSKTTRENRACWDSNIPDRSCFSDGAAVKRAHLSEHAGPPTTGVHGDPDAPSPTAESLNMSLLSLIFFPDAGGAGRQTQTRPDQTFGERRGGRCGVSGQPLLASPSKQKGMKAGARLCLCGSCRAPLICSDDVY